MSKARPGAGKHRLARHRAPSGYERARDRTLDTVASAAENGGKVVVVTATGGALAAAAIVGAQVAAQGSSDVAQAGTRTDATPTATPSTKPAPTAKATARTQTTVSRDASRPSLSALKRKAAVAATGEQTVAAAKVITKKATVDVSDPRGVARDMLGGFGWGQDQFPCLDALWIGESNWRVNADNPSSSAYGIPQALPGSKMASAGADWQTNPATQIKWGLGYIESRYGTPCGAQAFKRGHGWY